jgi:hypothetical protein
MISVCSILLKANAQLEPSIFEKLLEYSLDHDIVVYFKLAFQRELIFKQGSPINSISVAKCAEYNRYTGAMQLN